MEALNITLQSLQEAMKGQVEASECIRYYEQWDKLRIKGEQLITEFDIYTSSNSGEMSKVFPSLIAATEEWFSSEFNQHNNKNYTHLMPIIISLYDLLLSLKRSYEGKSAMSCGIITRAMFEARINLVEIATNPDILMEQFSRYKDVAKYWNEYRSDIITKEVLLSHIKEYPEWFDADWKTMKNKRSKWTGIINDNVLKMSERNGLQSEYKTLYKTTSAFVHISPLIANYYSVQGNGPVCKESGVFQMTFIGLSQFIEAFISALKIIDLDTDLAHGSLHIPLTIITKLNMGK